MGNRAIIIFKTIAHPEKNSEVFSYGPQVYLHWNGDATPQLILAVKEKMRGRDADIDYTTARFIGGCHEKIDGNLSLGVFNNPFARDSESYEALEKITHGDCGVWVVDCGSWIGKQYMKDYETKEFKSFEVNFNKTETPQIYYTESFGCELMDLPSGMPAKGAL